MWWRVGDGHFAEVMGGGQAYGVEATAHCISHYPAGGGGGAGAFCDQDMEQTW